MAYNSLSCLITALTFTSDKVRQRFFRRAPCWCSDNQKGYMHTVTVKEWQNSPVLKWKLISVIPNAQALLTYLSLSLSLLFSFSLCLSSFSHSYLHPSLSLLVLPHSPPSRPLSPPSCQFQAIRRGLECRRYHAFPRSCLPITSPVQWVFQPSSDTQSLPKSYNSSEMYPTLHSFLWICLQTNL